MRTSVEKNSNDVYVCTWHDDLGEFVVHGVVPVHDSRVPVYFEDEFVKRYAVFAYDHQYPNGGYGDLRDSFDSLDKAVELAQKEKGPHRSADILDRIAGRWIDVKALLGKDA